jgi:uncharacterized protein YjbI with pentapeptide repeats
VLGRFVKETLLMAGSAMREWKNSRIPDRMGVPTFVSADLEERDFSGDDLRNVDFRGAYLTGAKLVGTNLRGADLRRAHLNEANLQGADLSGANLSGSDLRGADLNRATLDNAIVKETILDPDLWVKPLLALWNRADDTRREHLIRALEEKTALRGKWVDGANACPEAILSERGAETDDFMSAWNTYAITEEHLLMLLKPRT